MTEIKNEISNSKSAPPLSVSHENREESNVTINWDDVNRAIKNYDFAAKGYYLEREYKEEQKELNCVMVSNYDSSKYKWNCSEPRSVTRKVDFSVQVFSKLKRLVHFVCPAWANSNG